MKLFKQRLAETFAITVILLGVVLISIALGLSLCLLVKYYPNVVTIVMFSAIALYLCYMLYLFIKWLFIDPFRQKKRSDI